MAMHKPLCEYKKYTAAEQQRLLASLAEQLKLPLLQIALTATNASGKEELATIGDISHEAMELIDGYLLSLRLNAADDVPLEPVSLSAILHDTAHQLNKMAKLYNCDVELRVAAAYPPVLAHTQGLQVAMQQLGRVLIEAQRKNNTRRPVVTLAAHRNRWGLVAGAYSDNTELNTSAFTRAQQLYGTAQQPIGQLVSSAGTGVFIADALLRAMEAHLRPARYQKLTGLATTLHPSRQLALI